MNVARRDSVLALALGGLLVVKMVAFEPFRPTVAGLRVEAVAVLLPLALPLGGRGVASLGLGCGLAHTLHGSGLLEGVAAGAAVAASLAAVVVGIRRPWDVEGVLVRCLVLTALLAATLGMALAIVWTQPVLPAVAETFASVAIPVAVAGPALLLVVRRIATGRHRPLAEGVPP